MPCTRPLWPAPLAGLAALGLYVRTLAPGLTWAHHAADGGDLLAAALTQGVPHPSGYPTYQLLLRAAIAVFPGEPARAGNWLSALCAAAAVALFADLAGRMLAQIVSRADAHAAGDATACHENRRGSGDVGILSVQSSPDPLIPAMLRAATPMLSGLAALAAALTWAASPIFWGQAVVTEVYALNALVVVGVLWLLWRWREAVEAGGPGWPWLAGAGLAMGLGLGNHLTLLLMLPGAAVWLWAERRAAGRSLAQGLLAALIAAAAGLAVYAYLPLAAAANPPVNWGDPRGPTQLWASVSGQVYRGLALGLPLAYLPGRLAAWSGEALRQFGGPWGAILALIGLWRLDRRLHAWWQTTLLVALAYSVYAIGYNTPDSFVYLIPAWCVAALWLAAGLDWLLETVTQGLARKLWAIKGSDRMAQEQPMFEADMPARRGATADANERGLGDEGISSAASPDPLIPAILGADAHAAGDATVCHENRRGSGDVGILSVQSSPDPLSPAMLRADAHAAGDATACHENRRGSGDVGILSVQSSPDPLSPAMLRAAGAWPIRVALIGVILAIPVISTARFWRENDLSHDREAQEFVTRTLADAAPDAMILTSGDGPTFALWYAVYGLGQRPDVAPVNVNLVSFGWYRRTLAARHPDFTAALSAFDPTRPEASLTAMAAKRPLYRAETLSVPLPGYDEQPEGSLVRLTRQTDK